VEIKEKKVLKRLKGSRCSLSVAPVGPGPTKIVEEDNQIYNRYEVKPEFPGMAKFYKYVDNYRAPEEEGLRGKVYVTFVGKDGSLTDIKVLRDIGGEQEEVARKVRDGIQVFKMGSRLEYYILFRSKFKQRINVGKGIKIFRRNRSKSDFFSLWQFCFRFV
jgi:hypothetical protein